LALVLISSASLAEAQDFSMDFDRARAGLDGEPHGLEYLRGCVEQSALCALAAGTGLQHSGRTDEAIEFFQRALAGGEGVAASALAFVHLQAEEYKEAYAWARLAMEIARRKQNLSRAELLRNQNAFIAAAAIQTMNESERDPAEQEAMRLLREWQHVLPAATVDEAEADPGYTIVKRRAPRYPRRLAIDRIEGTVYLHARVNERGKVAETIPVYFTHLPFVKEAERAFRKWKIEFEQSDDGRDLTVNQLIDFNLLRE
jgi:tetratricopeptide (TPR) repeat protein